MLVLAQKKRKKSREDTKSTKIYAQHKRNALNFFHFTEGFRKSSWKFKFFIKKKAAWSAWKYLFPLRGKRYDDDNRMSWIDNALLSLQHEVRSFKIKTFYNWDCFGFFLCGRWKSWKMLKSSVNHQKVCIAQFRGWSFWNVVSREKFARKLQFKLLPHFCS